MITLNDTLSHTQLCSVVNGLDPSTCHSVMPSLFMCGDYSLLSKYIQAHRANETLCPIQATSLYNQPVFIYLMFTFHSSSRPYSHTLNALGSGHKTHNLCETATL